MGANRFKINVRPLSIILLSGVLIYFSCTNDEPLEKHHPIDIMASRGIHLPSLTNIFNCLIESLEQVLEILSTIDERESFIGDFINEYGIPLWNLHTL